MAREICNKLPEMPPKMEENNDVDSFVLSLFENIQGAGLVTELKHAYLDLLQDVQKKPFYELMQHETGKIIIFHQTQLHIKTW